VLLDLIPGKEPLRKGLRKSTHSVCTLSDTDNFIIFIQTSCILLLHILNITFRFLVPDEGELTTQFSQQQIASSVDIASATKHFDLCLAEFGPYR
jgi:hypothetical protein